MMTKKLSKRFHSGVPFPVLLTSFAVGLSLCSVLIIGLTFYFTASGSLKEHVDDLSTRQLTQAVGTLSERLSQIEVIGQTTASDESLKDGLYNCRQYGKIEIDLFYELSDKARRTYVKARYMMEEIDALILLTDYGTVSSKNTILSNTTQTSFAEHFGWETGKPQFHFPDPSDTPDPSYWSEDLRYYEQCLLYSCPVEKNGKTVGTICYVLSPKLISSSLEPQISAAVLCDTDRLIYNSTGLDDDAVLQFYADPDAPAFSARVTLPQYGLTILHRANTETLESSLRSLRRIGFLMGFVVLVISLTASILFSRSLTRPLINIRNAMGEINSRASLRKPLLRGKLSSRNYIRIYLTVIVLISSFLFSIISYRVFLDASNRIVLTTAEASFRQSLSNTNATLSNLYHTSFNFAYDTEFQRELSESAAQGEKAAISEGYIRQSLGLYTIPVNLRILNTDREVLFSTDYFVEEDLSSPVTRKAQWKPLAAGSRNLISLSYEIIDFRELNALGTLILEVDELHIRETSDFFSGDRHSVYLHTPDGLVLSGSDKSAIGRTLPPPGKNTEQFSGPLADADLILTTYFDTSSMRRNLNQAVRSMVYFFLFLSLVVFISNILISNYLSKQFRDLGDTLANVSLNDPAGHSEPVSMISEINRTYAAFHEMQQRILTLMDDNVKSETQRYALELDKQQMEMQLLQSQINPHFLYNTFEAVNSMIANGDTAGGMRTLNELAEMLRYSTKNKAIMVPLREELQHARLYMSIMAIHSRQLTVHYDISPEAYEVPTVRFILQPILENAIRHGLKPKGGAGNIQITGKIANSRLILVVRDDGVGMDEVSLKALNHSLTDRQAQTSIGLPNIANRLRLSHGEAGRLIIDSEEGMGCAVTIIQPIP